MPSRLVVIADNSPLSALWDIGQLHLLKALFDEILIPEAVYDEFIATETEARQAFLDSAEWIHIVAVASQSQLAILRRLDIGEAAVIASAIEQNADLLIIDEIRGRQAAKQLGLSVTGTLGVLLAAKSAGIITTIKPSLKQLQATGFYLSNTLIEYAMKQANESFFS